MQSSFDAQATSASPATRRRALAALLVTATASRLIPHAPNFTTVPAVALMAGLLFGRTWLAFAVPLLAMVLSDLALGMAVYGMRAFQWLLPVYACIAATVWLGMSTSRAPRSVVFGAVSATAMFFFVTNLFVWLGSSFYPATAAGLLACYAAALPFAANMLLSTLAFSLALLATWHVVERRFLRVVPS